MRGRVGSADRQFVQGAEVVVTALTRSIRYVVLIGGKGTGNPSPTARRAGGQFVLGAYLVVTSLTRSVRYIVRVGRKGTGDPSPTVVYDHAPMYR